MKTTRLKEHYCPNCNAPINAATSFGDNTPEEGDVSICSDCTSYLVFGKDLNIQLMTDEQLLELDNETLTTLTEYRSTLQSLK